jgi:hypothetical protein
MILQAGGTLDSARNKLDELRRRLGLTMRLAGEIEAGCLQVRKATIVAKIESVPQEKKPQPKSRPDPNTFTVKGHCRPLEFVVGCPIND